MKDHPLEVLYQPRGFRDLAQPEGETAVSRRILSSSLAILCALIASATPGRAYWPPDGVAVSAVAPHSQYPEYPGIISDGASGAIVTWYDDHNGDYDIFAQRVSASGNVMWTVGGVSICTATGDQKSPQIVSDGAGGAIITWSDYRFGNWDIYARRVNASGAVLWTSNGVSICTATGDQKSPQIVSDGAGGAIITWSDNRVGNSDIYTQRVNASGAVQWTADGAVVCLLTGSDDDSRIIADGAGGAIIVWLHYVVGTTGPEGIPYIQRINASGVSQWPSNGVYLTTAHPCRYPRLVSDGALGAIVAYQVDGVPYTYNKVVAVKVTDPGGVVGGSIFVLPIYAPQHVEYPDIVPDGAGGAIISVQSEPLLPLGDSSFNISAQRLSSVGAMPWGEYGLCLSQAGGPQTNARLITDGAGGAIAAWQDWGTRSGQSNIYVQRVNRSATVRWAQNGVALTAGDWRQEGPALASDGAEGIIVAWTDFREGGGGIYVQTVDCDGNVGMLKPAINSIHDVPNDQGGHVRISIFRSGLDTGLEPTYPVSRYDVWQRIDDPVLLSLLSGADGGGVARAAQRGAPLQQSADALIEAGWPLIEQGGRLFVRAGGLLGAGSFPPGAWELLGSYAATQQNEYVFRAGTLADSTASGIPYSVYVVSAHTTTPTVWYASDPDSGYSVDNLPPETPADLAAEQRYSPMGLSLSWDPSAANDISHYAVYRGAGEDFVPSPGNRLATPVEPGWFDGSWCWSSGSHYKISAIDIHGNESGFALIRPADVTGDDSPGTPAAGYLRQNYPNPFNPLTRIVFGLSEPAHVSLRIYDASGRLVRVLTGEKRPAGQHEEFWDGSDDKGSPVSSGFYFYRLRAGAFEDTKKMTLVR
jgi:hypothetical protein